MTFWFNKAKILLKVADNYASRHLLALNMIRFDLDESAYT